MKNITPLWLLLFSLLYSACGIPYTKPLTPNTKTLETSRPAANRDLPPYAEPGKCYARAKSKPSTLSEQTKQIFEYTGSEFSNSDIVKIDIEIEPASVEWVNKQDPDCKSTNSE